MLEIQIPTYIYTHPCMHTDKTVNWIIHLSEKNDIHLHNHMHNHTHTHTGKWSMVALTYQTGQTAFYAPNIPPIFLTCTLFFSFTQYTHTHTHTHTHTQSHTHTHMCPAKANNNGNREMQCINHADLVQTHDYERQKQPHSLQLVPTLTRLVWPSLRSKDGLSGASMQAGMMFL